jgi:hypothetical protein
MNYIIYPNERGGVSLVIPTGELAIEEFDAWEYSDAAIVNMDKAKAIGHDMRRAMRAEEFKPHDEVIMKQIPGADAAEAEAARQAIREKYAEIQDAIDAATTTDTIKAALEVTP